MDITDESKELYYTGCVKSNLEMSIVYNSCTLPCMD